MFAVSTHDVLLVFTDKGRVFKLKGYDIPEGSRTARGTAIVNILQLEADEKVKKIINLPNDVADEDGYDMSGTLFFATERGYVKRTNLEDFRNIIVSIQTYATSTFHIEDRGDARFHAFGSQFFVGSNSQFNF